MQSINHVVISGNLTRDCDLKATQSGASVLQLGIAVNRSRRNNRTGEWEDVPNYFDIAVYGKRADSLAHILKKGMRIVVSGHLRWHTWEKDGQKRSKVDIVADEIELPPRPQQQPPQANGYTKQQLENPQTWQQPAYDDYYGDEIPFG